VAKYLLFVLVVVMFCSGGTAWACDCGKRDPQPCQLLSATDVVFVGTVLRIDTDMFKEEESTGSPETVSRFHIDEKISGTTGPEIDLYPGLSNDGCGYPFIEGGQYVVFAFQGGKGQLYTTVCSGTRSIESAQALLVQLRAMRDNQPIPSVYGVLRNAEQPFGSPSVKFPGEPLANTRVRLRSEDRIFESKTDASGSYAFYGVPAGEYQLTADLPANLELAHAFLDAPLRPLKTASRSLL